MLVYGLENPPKNCSYNARCGGAQKIEYVRVSSAMALTPWVRDHLKQDRPAGERSDTETSPGLPNVLSGNIAGEALYPAPEGSIKKAHKTL